VEACWELLFTDKEQQLVSIVELVQIEPLLAPSSAQRFGRKKHDRRALARSFAAKAVYNHPDARATLAIFGTLACVASLEVDLDGGPVCSARGFKVHAHGFTAGKNGRQLS
jgi:hypothetical protein